MLTRYLREVLLPRMVIFRTAGVSPAIWAGGPQCQIPGARSAAAAQADVAPAEAFRPVDLIDRAVRPIARCADVAAECGHAEHPAAIGEQPFAITLRAGVEDLDLVLAAGCIETADLAAAQRVVRISLGGHHDPQRRLG